MKDRDYAVAFLISVCIALYIFLIYLGKTSDQELTKTECEARNGNWVTVDYEEGTSSQTGTRSGSFSTCILPYEETK